MDRESFDEYDDEDDAYEVATMEPYQSTANQRLFHSPTFEKCPHCDEEGNIQTGVREFATTSPRAVDGVARIREMVDCEHCEGMGYLNVPDSNEAADEAFSRNRADLVLIRKRQFMTRGFCFWG